MKYLPFEEVTYKTRLSRSEVINKLNNATEPRQSFRFNFFGSKRTKPYQGEVADNGFNLTRIIGYRNSFLPVIKGTFIDNGTGLEINVKMKLHTFVVVFIIAWMSFVGVAALMVVAAFFFTHIKLSSGNLVLLIPVAMLIFGYLMTLGGFKYESVQSKKDFKTIFEAEMIEN